MSDPFSTSHSETLFREGLALQQSGDLAGARARYGAALAVNPRYAEVHVERGIAFWLEGQAEAALADYDRAIALRPDLAVAFINRGVALRALRRLPEALASLDDAVRLAPTHAGAYNNRGAVLSELGDHAAALASFARAVSLQPGNVKSLNNQGVALDRLGRHAEAIASFDAALAIEPVYGDALSNRASAQKSLGRFEAAAAGYRKAFQCAPSIPYLPGMLINAAMMICDWQDFDGVKDAIVAGLAQGAPVTPPFNLLALADQPDLQRRAAEIWTADKHPAAASRPAVRPHGKIRLGYFSADFRDHPVAALAAELFENHDRRAFDVTAFSFGPDTQDDMRKRLECAFDRFIDVRGKSEQDIAELARGMELDIAIDLAGYTSDARAGIFSRRAAPVQVNFLGYPGTMGADFIDYIVADATVIPPAAQAHYAEKIIYLPCFQPNDSRRAIAESTPARAAMGLPEAGVVFCCFNNAYKINPPVFDSWARILMQVDGSVLWLSAHNDAAVRNLRAAASRRGIDPGRLVFAQRVPSAAEHLARHHCADIFLDTWPYNAHTTASDALWAGLPVLTFAGRSFAASVAASLLKAVGLPELITEAQEDYEALAVTLARAPKRIAELKEKLARNLPASRLFDSLGFTRALEESYRKIYART